jgi:flagellar hook protein FlgE
MLRAMDSAVAGLRAHQNKLDVIGNNIANVNTQGFKSQNYTFKDAMYQTETKSTAGDKDGKAGGVNASQYGYGSVTGSIATDMTAGTPSYVGGFNAAINGSGFFVTTSTKDGQDFSYTRVGQFHPDSQGYVVDANGNYLRSFADKTNVGDAIKIPGTVESVSVDNNGVITYVPVDGTEAQKAGTLALANFKNPAGLTKAGNNTYTHSTNDDAGDVTYTQPGGTAASLMSGYLEASNVDLAKEFSDMITTERGFQANAKIITVSDEVLQELVNMKR